jgi:cation diffusion facilitator CzcD-associated flavoprotein CzcO
MMTAKTVAIVGAGSAGLVAAKVLMEDGFNVTLFERQKHIGGIWSPDWAYADLKTQTVAGFMEFSDLHDTEGNSSLYILYSYAMNLIHISSRLCSLATYS